MPAGTRPICRIGRNRRDLQSTTLAFNAGLAAISNAPEVSRFGRNGIGGPRASACAIGSSAIRIRHIELGNECVAVGGDGGERLEPVIAAERIR